MAHRPSPKRWSSAERQRLQEALDEARLSAERRRAVADSARSPGGMVGTPERVATPRDGRHDDPVPDSTSARKWKSAWTAEERARLQAALDRVYVRPRELSPVSSDSPSAPARVARGGGDGASSPLDGGSWTSEQRAKVEAALAELKAVRLASAVQPIPGRTVPLALQSVSAEPATSPAEETVEEREELRKTEAPARFPEVSEGALPSVKPERLFGATRTEVMQHPETEEPVLVQQAADCIAPQEFALPPAPARQRPRWYGHLEGVEVHGLHIPGLVRVALQPPPKGEQVHPATIAAWMPAETSALTEEVEPLQDIWTTPSFSSLTPAHRGLYLRWLASGRSFDVPPRLALLFVFNLESRVVVEGVGTLEDDQRREMACVARGLAKRYGGALPQLRNCALSLAGFLEAPDAPRHLYQCALPELPETFETPALLQVAIGQAARDAAPLPPEWALASVLCDLYMPKRTPVGRCPAELRELFSYHFETSFPRGLRVQRRSASSLTVHYRGLPDPRTGISAESSVSVPTVSQASLDDSQTNALRQIVAKCADDLSAYSRFIGRNPAAVGTPDSEVRLPPFLLTQRLAKKIAALAASAAGGKFVTLDDAWMALWGRLPERKDSAPFLRELLESKGLVVVHSAQLRTGSSRPTPAGSRAFQLDPVKLEKVREDEAESSKLLAALFADVDEHPTPAHQAESHDNAARAMLPTLDEAHFKLLTTLLGGEDWDRDTLQATANRLGLMLDGALELINEAVFEIAGGPLVTDDGGLELDADAAAEVTSAFAAKSQTGKNRQ